MVLKFWLPETITAHLKVKVIHLESGDRAVFNKIGLPLPLCLLVRDSSIMIF